MKCNIEWLSTYLDGLLSDEKRAKLEEHLKTCEACAAKLEEFARVEQTAKKIPAPQLSEAYWENFANRVQNKLTIRERRKTTPAWLEALKSFFQPTTGKLAIAGSVAVIILLTFVSLDQWKKETFRPPVFEAETPKTERKLDSAQVPAKDESEFRTAEKDNKAGLVEDKRLDQATREKGTATLSQKPADNAPAAAAPVGRALAAPEGQMSKEEPSLAAFAEQEESVMKDTTPIVMGKNALIREKTVARSIQPDTGKNSEQSPQNNDKPATIQTKESAKVKKDLAPKDKRKVSGMDRGDTTMSGILHEFITNEKGDTIGVNSYPYPLSVETESILQAKEAAMLRAEAERTMNDLRQIIGENEKKLKGDLSKSETESLYIYLAQHYVQLYRFSLDQRDWEKANQRLTDFLKADLYESNRRWLVAIQTELKKLKK